MLRALFGSFRQNNLIRQGLRAIPHVALVRRSAAAAEALDVAAELKKLADTRLPAIYPPVAIAIETCSSCGNESFGAALDLMRPLSDLELSSCAAQMQRIIKTTAHDPAILFGLQTTAILKSQKTLLQLESTRKRDETMRNREFVGDLEAITRSASKAISSRQGHVSPLERVTILLSECEKVTVSKDFTEVHKDMLSTLTGLKEHLERGTISELEANSVVSGIMNLLSEEFTIMDRYRDQLPERKFVRAEYHLAIGKYSGLLSTEGSTLLKIKAQLASLSRNVARHITRSLMPKELSDRLILRDLLVHGSTSGLHFDLAVSEKTKSKPITNEDTLFLMQKSHIAGYEEAFAGTKWSMLTPDDSREIFQRLRANGIINEKGVARPFSRDELRRILPEKFLAIGQDPMADFFYARVKGALPPVSKESAYERISSGAEKTNPTVDAQYEL